MQVWSLNSQWMMTKRIFPSFLPLFSFSSFSLSFLLRNSFIFIKNLSFLNQLPLFILFLFCFHNFSLPLSHSSSEAWIKRGREVNEGENRKEMRENGESKSFHFIESTVWKQSHVYSLNNWLNHESKPGYLPSISDSLSRFLSYSLLRSINRFQQW